jgi:hypothetical protein
LCSEIKDIKRFGRDWLSKIKLNWQKIFDLSDHKKSRGQVPESVDYPPDFKRALLYKHEGLFNNERNGIRGVKASLKLKPEAKPVFQKSRPVPYSLTNDVQKEYNRLMQADIPAYTRPVTFSEWAVSSCSCTQ